MTDSNDKFLATLKEWPSGGQVLRTIPHDQTPVIIVTEKRRGDRIVKFTRCVVDPEGTGWYLSNDPRGLLCMIQDSDHDKVSNTVTKLVVLRRATHSKCLICGVLK